MTIRSLVHPISERSRKLDVLCGPKTTTCRHSELFGAASMSYTHFEIKDESFNTQKVIQIHAKDKDTSLMRKIEFCQEVGVLLVSQLTLFTVLYFMRWSLCIHFRFFYVVAIFSIPLTSSSKWPWLHFMRAWQYFYYTIPSYLCYIAVYSAIRHTNGEVRETCICKTHKDKHASARTESVE